MKRKHAELAAQYMADDTLKCWVWVTSTYAWKEVPYPAWSGNRSYVIGYEPPTAPPVRMCTLGGLEFPEPLNDEPARGKTVFHVI